MIYLKFLPEFGNYGIEKQIIKNLTARQTVPQIKLAEEERKKLVSSVKTKAKVGFLLGQDQSTDGTEFYTIDMDYLKSLLNAGADLRFLDYDNCVSQLEDCDGLVLPGGSFNSPKAFYVKGIENAVSKRAKAYIYSVMVAENAHKPILGICAGAQMIGGLHNRKMYASLKDENSSPVVHKTKDNQAHEILIFEDTPLADIMQSSGKMVVNSRHNEAMIEDCMQKAFAKTDLTVYAVSTGDNIPEAWGNKEKNILCIQWHPENLAVNQNASMQNIYDWVVDKSAHYRKQQLKLNPLSFIKQNFQRI